MDVPSRRALAERTHARFGGLSLATPEDQTSRRVAEEREADGGETISGWRFFATWTPWAARRGMANCAICSAGTRPPARW